ncbi:MAG: UDP-N-acetylglucosamine 2-epimerase (non-hydrolyzing) [Hyphomicrobiales bacterium]|nr:UDP-N-acetylglucosamine 2-epimerase (non-hydrolyzing) [Hyphomicrobiales bacterium]
MAVILSVVGARPQFIKAAPVSRALQASGLSETLIHTGQHFDDAMSELFFAELSIPRPAHNLGINSLGQGAMTGRMLEGLERVMLAEKPRAVLVYGDTNSTAAGALAAAKLQIPVVHVEAGLRSFDRRMPEEINRVVADHLSNLLFCPTRQAVENLRREGIEAGVHHVGDVMYDLAIIARQTAQRRSRILDELGVKSKSYAVATVHRAENTDSPERFASLMEWLVDAARDMPVIMPVHPRTRKIISASGSKLKGVTLIGPLAYFDMAWLVHNAASVFTDSGGLQKEAYFHRVPCVTLRDNTEWVETIEAGWNRLWTTPHYRPRTEIADYGEGRSSEVLAGVLESFLSKSA